MQLHGRMRLAACVAPPLVVLIAVGIVSCRDALTSGKGDLPSNDALVTRATGVSEAAARARMRLHERNPHDWVGKAHNRALDDFRKELRKPGVLTRNVCDYVSDFSTRAELVPFEKRAVMSEKDQRAVRRVITTGLCGRRAAFSPQDPEVRLVTNTGLTRTSFSPPANELLVEVTNAISAATSSYDLASRLQPILDAAAGLDTADQAAVAVNVSVAQNSFEYWESQLPTFQQEVEAEYGQCATEYQKQGYSWDEAGSACLDGHKLQETRDQRSPSGPRVSVIARFATLSPPICYTAWDGIVETVRFDRDGAISGFVGGLIATRTLQGGFIAAFGAAVANSVKQALHVTWDLIICAYKP